MKLTTRQFLASLLAFTLPAARAQSSAAEAYPTRPITVIVPFPAGTIIDSICRAVVESIQRRTGATLVVENVAGAGSLIGTARAARAKPDGYTLLYGTSSGLVIIPQVNKAATFTPDSFEPIISVAHAPYFLTVPPNSPYRTAREMFDAARAKPMELTYGTNGVASSLHLTIAAILSATQSEMRHVPFRGGQDMLLAAMRGDVQVIPATPDVLELVAAGKLKVLAITQKSRLAAAPEVPTIGEALGIQGLESGAWTAFVGPKGLPQPLVTTLNRWVNEALKDPAVVSVISKGHYSIDGGTPQDLRDKMRVEYANWASVIKSQKIEAEK